MERNNRKTFLGVVTSTKMDKTITVQVNTLKGHSLYGKNQKVSKKYHVHDENSVAHVGDVVKVMETRPLSATVKYRLVEVVEKNEE